MDEGEPRFVTDVSRSDVIGGWRERRHEGGVLIEVSTGRIVSDQLLMSHSPREFAGGLLVLPLLLRSDDGSSASHPDAELQLAPRDRQNLSALSGEDQAATRMKLSQAAQQQSAQLPPFQ